MAATTIINGQEMARANRIVVRDNTNGGYTAVFFRTHAEVGSIDSTDGWVAPTGKTTATARRENFRAWAAEHSTDVGVAFSTEYQAQSWNRKYWKYETDEQVEEDAKELMEWSIKTACTKAKHNAVVTNITVDSIIAGDSNLSYVEDGRYTKNGNWAVATVRLSVEVTIDDVNTEFSWDIEMRSGQLTKIKMTTADIKALMAEGVVATA